MKMGMDHQWNNINSKKKERNNGRKSCAIGTLLSQATPPSRYVTAVVHTKHIDALCGQNVEFVDVKTGGTYSNHWA
jgi:hypothetical protein